MGYNDQVYSFKGTIMKFYLKYRLFFLKGQVEGGLSHCLADLFSFSLDYWGANGVQSIIQKLDLIYVSNPVNIPNSTISCLIIAIYQAQKQSLCFRNSILVPNFQNVSSFTWCSCDRLLGFYRGSAGPFCRDRSLELNVT